MKIGVVFPSITNSYYRAVWPVGTLRDRGHETVLVQEDDNGRFDARLLEGCDVVYAYRTSGQVLPRVLDKLRRRGVGVVFDNDDDHRLIPQGSPEMEKFTGFAGHQKHRDIQRMLRQADVVTTTSDFLAERFAQDFDGPIEVLENYLGHFQYVKDRPAHDGILIGWVAGMEHRVDAQQLRLTETFRRVMERDPRVRVETLGVRLDLDPSRYQLCNDVKFEDLGTHVSRWDIGIAPICDVPMNHARSNVKVKEYAAAGVPWIASDRGEYAKLGTRCGGILIADDAWEETLVDLAGARFRRRMMRRAAQSWARTQRIEDHLDKWEAVVQRAAASSADRAQVA
jgi:glycosyltransferase involved in cell wall biosynthesis